VGAEHSRGASALGYKARSVRVLNQMTAGEGAQASVDNHRLYFRTDSGKQNLVRPSAAATWYRLESIALGNMRPDRSEDDVGVVTPWQWPAPLDGLPDDALLKVQQAVDSGQWRESSQAKEWVGKAVAETLGFDLDDTGDKGRVKALIKTWLDDGSLEAFEGEDEKRNSRMFVRVGRRAAKS
jgi:hypothetical protein